MRSFDSQGLTICKIQARLFERSVKELDCSSAVFIRNYMNSPFAERVDSPMFLSDSYDDSAILQDMKNAYSNRDGAKYSESAMYWIGYLYRYWCYTHEISSRKAYSFVQGPELKALYQPYHTLDCSAAIDRIIEAKGIVEKPDPLALFKQINKEDAISNRAR